MPRIRPTEHKAVVALLSQPAESVEDLASEVIITLDEMRAKRDDWYLIVNDPGVCVHLHGPYTTKAAALKEIERGDVYAASPGAKALIVPIIRSTDEGIEQCL